MKKFNLAIVGASGLVGSTVIKILQEEDILNRFNLTLFVSDKSAGKTVTIAGTDYRYILLSKSEARKHFDYVIMSAGDDISKEYANIFAESGTKVIDNSNAFRRVSNVPLVVPEINIKKIKSDDRIIANPNCSTIQLVVVLDRLKKLADINKVIVSSYQSVSGAGTQALEDLKNGSKLQITEGIKNNLVPYIGETLENGYCVEEDKIMFETNKILESNIDVSATTVRVPVPYCHLESVYVYFDKDINLNELNSLLNTSYIKYSTTENFYPVYCADSNLTFVCRMRLVSSKEISFIIIADNLRRGAAYNAVEILKQLTKLR